MAEPDHPRAANDNHTEARQAIAALAEFQAKGGRSFQVVKAELLRWLHVVPPKSQENTKE